LYLGIHGASTCSAKWAESIDLIRHAARLGHARQITYDNCFCSRHSGERLLSSPLIASVQDNPVSLLDQELSGHSAESIGSPCNKRTRHDLSPPAQ
jgi:hypothetical protein